jgi:hypothetical protein
MITKTTISQSLYFQRNATKSQKAVLEKKNQRENKSKVSLITPKQRRLEMLKQVNLVLIEKFNIRIYSTKTTLLFGEFKKTRDKHTKAPKDPRKANNKTLLEFAQYIQTLLF